MKKSILLAVSIIIALTVCYMVIDDSALATNAYLAEFENVFPWTIGTKLDDCVTCHDAGQTTLNPYGQEVQAWINNSVPIANAIVMATYSGEDSDGDGYYNYEEVEVIAYPGDASDYPLCVDRDYDGYYGGVDCQTAEWDCNDSSYMINPGRNEQCTDGIDNDCDNLVDTADPDCACTDNDGDGFYLQSYCGTQLDCNDADSGINPNACDIKRDGIDQDCDGYDRTGGPPCK